MGISCRFVSDCVALLSMRCDLDKQILPAVSIGCQSAKVRLGMMLLNLSLWWPNSLVRYVRRFILVRSHCWLLSHFAVFRSTIYLNHFFFAFFSGQLVAIEYFVLPSSTSFLISVSIHWLRIEKRSFFLSCRVTGRINWRSGRSFRLDADNDDTSNRNWSIVSLILFVWKS